MSHAVTTARRNLDYAKASDREIRRLRRENESLTGALLAARTAAAHLRDENKALRDGYTQETPCRNH